MNIEQLLDEWLEAIRCGRQRALTNMTTFPDGSATRITRSEGTPIVYDFLSATKQATIQQALRQELPHLNSLISSIPATDGYHWKVGDYIELYFNHYELVIQKIRETVANVQK